MNKSNGMEDIRVEDLERMAGVLRLLAHPQRLQIVQILNRVGESPVHSLCVELGLAQAATSHHLSLMKRVGLVTCTRRGKECWYRIEDPRALTILNCIRKQGQSA